MPVDPTLIAAMNAPLRAGRSTPRYANKAGYFMPPGTGPIGKTCGDCEALRAFSPSSACGRAFKCGKASDSKGKRSDIVKKSPACGGFEEGKANDQS